jgi:hypothetical protein
MSTAVILTSQQQEMCWACQVVELLSSVQLTYLYLQVPSPRLDNIITVGGGGTEAQKLYDCLVVWLFRNIVTTAKIL